METTDIVIHKGEKEEKYQLYVEDYVMSFLKNYGSSNGRKIFFYGTREQKNNKYYIYGAGQQKNISYFVRYELLDEIVCRFDMDKPVFFIKEDSGRYELSGYYIFYQSNEAMQSYMIEQRKGQEAEEKRQEKSGTENKIRPQDFSDIRTRNGLKLSDDENGNGSEKQSNIKQTYVRNKREKSERSKGGIMAFQLLAVFLVLAAIIINSTNSYSKLRELGQSAVEVFFTMENQEASKMDDGKAYSRLDVSEVTRESGISETLDELDLPGEPETSDVVDGTLLRLEDLDAEFEKENQEAKGKTDNLSAQETDNVEDVGSSMQQSEEVIEDKAERDIENSNGETEQDKENEESPSKEAFARNFAQYYKIEKGDTLCNISIKLYGDASKVNEICEINKIDDPDNIKYGQKILLP